MNSSIASPTNRFLIAQRDRRWPRVLSTILVVSAVMLLVLLLVGWPRLVSTSVHYDLIRLRAEVGELGERERVLELELENVRSPVRLGEQARRLGLVPPVRQPESPSEPTS